MLTPIWSWYEGHTITSLGKILKFSKFYVAKYMASSEVMTSSGSLICIYSYTTGQEMFCKTYAKLQSVITSLFFNRFSSGFHCYVWKFLLFLLRLSSNLLWSSSLEKHDPMLRNFHETGSLYFRNIPINLYFLCKHERMMMIWDSLWLSAGKIILWLWSIIQKHIVMMWLTVL